jgi:hypothetical protein
MYSTGESLNFYQISADIAARQGFVTVRKKVKSYLILLLLRVSHEPLWVILAAWQCYFYVTDGWTVYPSLFLMEIRLLARLT